MNIDSFPHCEQAGQGGLFCAHTRLEQKFKEFRYADATKLAIVSKQQIPSTFNKGFRMQSRAHLVLPDDSLTTLDGRRPLIEDNLKNEEFLARFARFLIII